jgi:hypothetical protein
MDEEDPTIGNNDSDDVDGQRNPYIASAPPPAIEPLPAFQITDPSLAMARAAIAVIAEGDPRNESVQ